MAAKVQKPSKPPTVMASKTEIAQAPQPKAHPPPFQVAKTQVPMSPVGDEMQRSKTIGPLVPRIAAMEEKGKTIRVYQNGDELAVGRRIAITKYNARTYDAALEMLSQVLHPPFGAVRRLYTPEHGHMVTSLDHIKDGGDYVAAPNVAFKPYPYHRIASGHTRAMQRSLSPNKLDLLPSFPRVIRSGKARKANDESPISIVVVKNGDTSGNGHRLLFGKRDLGDIDQILNRINDRVHLQSGALRKLYTFEGTRVVGPEDIVDGGEYVAVGRGAFINAAYTAANVSVQIPARKLPRMLPGTTTFPSYVDKARTLPFPNAEAPPQHVRAHTIEVLSPKKSFVTKKEEIKRDEPKPVVVEKSSPQKKAVSVIETKVVAKPVADSPAKPQVKSPSPVKPAPVEEQYKEEVVVKPQPKIKKPLKPEEKVQGYNVSVVTGDKESANTTANVFITIKGSKASSGKRKLNDDASHFDRGETDVFALESVELGDIEEIIIEHDNSGPSASWYLEKVIIRDVISNKKYYFHVNKWLAADRGEMATSLAIKASSNPNPPKPPAKIVERKIIEAEVVADSAETREDAPIDYAKADRVDDDNEPAPLDPEELPFDDQDANNEREVGADDS